MQDEFKNLIDEKNGFIKTVSQSPILLTAEQKVALNRKGNEFFNQGNIENARRIFCATGYSDGLTRIGDAYISEHKPIEALTHYAMAHNTRKTEPLCSDFAKIVSMLISED